MDRTERFYKIDALLSTRRVVSFAELRDACEVSRATLQRDLEYLRTRLNAPIVFDREAGGYRFERAEQQVGHPYELPGLWFNAQEIHALLTMQHLLANLDPGGLLSPHIAPLMARLNMLLGSADDPAEQIRRRVMVVGTAKRALQLSHFERVGSALLRRQRLRLRYFARGSGETTDREVSPQRLVHYRENWYLDAWCHLRKGLRNFALDSIESVEVLDRPAREIASRTVDSALGEGYGIFSGRSLQHARLQFSAERARWVRHEQWHPDQRGHLCEDGCYVLELPYADSRELVMDILKYGGDCTVLAPPELRQQVQQALQQALQQYT